MGERSRDREAGCGGLVWEHPATRSYRLPAPSRSRPDLHSRHDDHARLTTEPQRGRFSPVVLLNGQPPWGSSKPGRSATIKQIRKAPVRSPIVRNGCAFTWRTKIFSAGQGEDNQVGRSILLDSYLASNFGDDLLISLLCRRYPDNDFYLMCEESYLTRLGGLANIHAVGEMSPDRASLANRFVDKMRLSVGFPRSRFSRLFKARTFDLYLLFGGSLFIEGDRILDRGRRAELQLAVKRSRAAGIMNCNFGPYNSQAYLEAYRKVLGQMDFLSFRDSKSYDLFRDMENCVYGADLSLSLAGEPELQLTSPVDDASRGSRTMSIFPVLLTGRSGLAKYDKAYFDTIEELARGFLVEKDTQVVLIPCCEAEGDVEACERLCERLADSGRVEVLYSADVERIIRQIQESDILIASRFHSVCVGIANNIPVYVLSYSKKIDNMLSDLGISGRCVDIDTMDVKDADEIEATVTSPAAHERMATAEKQFEKLESALRLLE